MRFLNLLVPALLGAGLLCVACAAEEEPLSGDLPRDADDTSGYMDGQSDNDFGTDPKFDSETDEGEGSGDTSTGGSGDGGDSDAFEEKDGDGWYSDFDCDDENPDINPDAEELLGNHIDDDCDGEIDEEIDTDWDDSCASKSYEAKLERKPSDIIFILDNSGSMDLEAKWVQENMNDFSQQIAGSGVDYRVVVISSYPGNGNGICIAPPLGSGGCPIKDSKLPKFLHVNQEVGSNNGLVLFLATHPLWKGVLRPDSAKHIVIVSDDNSALPAFLFESGLNALSTDFSGYKFHGIFCYSYCSSAANVGTVYRGLVNKTGGVSGDLCKQNFTPVFNKLATAVVEESKISCKIPMPKAPAGKKINPDKVSIEIVPSPGSSAQEIPHVDGLGQCGSRGWYYNNNANPTKIILCPSTCNWAQGLTDAQLNVDSGCLEQVL